jgi:prepilin-type N-terminal cleavage/methylation domain-containing protein
MNAHPRLFRGISAFTLIELITVMAIISILMGLLVPMISMARTTARVTKAKTVSKAIVAACKNYVTDYGKYPPIPGALATAANASAAGYYSYGDTQTAKCKVTNNQLFDVLRAIDREPNGSHKLNRRKQRYFEESKATEVRNPRDGFADGKDFPSELQGQLLDPWGKQYCVILDADGDESLKVDDFFQDLTEPLRDTAVAFSLGKNNEIGGKGYQGRFRKERSDEAPEDIVSWE